jgi:hypothetical protein
VRVRLSRGLDRLRTSLGRVGYASSAIVIGDLLEGLPSHVAPSSLHARLADMAASPIVSASAAGAAGGWLLKLAIVAFAAAAVGGTAVVLVPSRIPETSAASAALPGRVLVTAMAPDSWLAVPGTRLSAVVPDPARYPRIQATNGPASIITSWSGAALDTRRDRLLVWGGGATNYWGNELYAFDIDRLAWIRLTDPAPDPVSDDRETNADGTPKSRSTYGGIAYIAHADRLFSSGGCFGPGAAPFATASWEFDPETERWIDRRSTSAWRGGFGCSCAYDPESGLVWWLCGQYPSTGGLWSYDHDRNTWTNRNADAAAEVACAMDTRRGLLVMVGNGAVCAYDVRHADYAKQVWATTGGDGFVAAKAPGLDYDPVADRFVGWSGGAVHVLDPETKAWTAHDSPGAPQPTANGIYGRWRYAPAVDAFVLVTAVEENVHFYRPPR